MGEILDTRRQLTLPRVPSDKSAFAERILRFPVGAPIG